MRKETLAKVIAEEFGEGHLYSWLIELYVDVQNILMKEQSHSTIEEAITIHNFVFNQLTKLKVETDELELKLIPEWKKAQF
jgi:hypothetical protein